MPLGVLKASVIRFDPVLPDDKLAAIARLGVGVLDRLVLRFDQAFWARDGVQFIGNAGEVPPRWAESVDLSAMLGAPVLAMFNAGPFAAELQLVDDDAAITSAMAASRHASVTRPAGIVASHIVTFSRIVPPNRKISWSTRPSELASRRRGTRSRGTSSNRTSPLHGR